MDVTFASDLVTFDGSLVAFGTWMDGANAQLLAELPTFEAPA